MTDLETIERAPEPISDSLPAADPAPAAPPPPEPEAGAEPSIPTRDSKLNDIAARFRDSRKAERAPEFNGDLSDPKTIYGAVAMEPEAHPAAVAPEPEPEPAPEPAPEEKRRFKLRVNHQDRELTEDEMIAAAQKALAADDILEDAKRIRREATQSPREPARPHQDDTFADQAEPAPEPSAAAPHQDDDLTKVVEDIQFGDPKEAATKLRDLITRETQRASQAETTRYLMGQDVERTMEQFNAFKDANPDLVNDPTASRLIQGFIEDGYREDLRKLGVPEDRMPTDINGLADYHRYYRVNRRPVRSAEQLLADSKARLDEWRGTARTPTPQPSQAQRPTQPRVAVDRTDRRATIPSQPTRSSAPPPSAPERPTEENSRAAAIQRMKAQRSGSAA